MVSRVDLVKNNVVGELKKKMEKSGVKKDENIFN